MAGAPYNNIHDVPASQNILDFPVNLLNFYLQNWVVNTIVILAILLVFIYIVFRWLSPAKNYVP
jgi:hypothetical protein